MEAQGASRRGEAPEEELVLYLDNEGLHQQKVHMFNVLARKRERGVYDQKLAPKPFVPFLNMVAQRYVKEFGSRGDKWNWVFTPMHRRRASSNRPVRRTLRAGRSVLTPNTSGECALLFESRRLASTRL